MSEKRFKVCIDSNNGVGLYDNSVRLLFIKFTNKEDAVSCKDSLKYQCNLMNELYDENEQLRKQIQNYEKLLSNSYVGEEETLDGFVGKYVIWEDVLNIKQMRLESLMKHREEIGKLFDRIDEQQATINKLQEENASLKQRIRDIKYNNCGD